MNKKKIKKNCPDKINFKNSIMTYKYFYKNIIYQNNDIKLISISDGNKNYSLIVSKKNLDKYVYYVCHTKNKLLLEFEDYGLSKNENPFDENTTKGTYYFIILKSNNIITLQDALMTKKINLYTFKQLFKNFLKNYSNLNRKTGFKYNNISMNTILLDNDKLVLYDFEKSTDNTLYKKISKLKEPKNIYNTKISNFTSSNNEILKLKKENHDIICILLLINYCEKILNKYPIQIYLNKEDNDILNSTDELFEKLKYIMNMDYFKTL